MNVGKIWTKEEGNLKKTNQFTCKNNVCLAQDLQGMADRRPFSEIMNINTVMEMDAEDDEEKANMFHEPMRRNLLDVFDKTLPPVADERMCVYLRVRPFSPKEIEEGEDQVCAFISQFITLYAVDFKLVSLCKPLFC